MVRQPIREKLGFISLRQAKRLANSSDTPMHLGIIRGIDDFSMQLKQTKTKTKISRPKLATTHGMMEGEKWSLMKETGPVTTEIPAETVIETHLQKADPAVCAPLRGIFDDYRGFVPLKASLWAASQEAIGPQDSSSPRRRTVAQKSIQAQQYRNGGTQMTD